MATIGGANSVNKNLAIHFDMGNPDSYPGSGTVLYDLSGNGRNGTLNNGPTFSTDGNGCLVFDGVDDTVTTTFNTLTSSTTFEIWANRNASINTYNMMFGMYLPYFAFNSSNSLHFSSNINGQKNIFSNTASKAVFNKIWYCFHFISKYDGVSTTVSMYVNGVYVIEQSHTGQQATPTIHPLVLGNWRPVVDYPFQGKIATVKGYTTALTAQEVLQNYNATKGRFGL